MSNELVDVKSNVQLLSLRGKVGKSSLCFLVDSGASANFISRSVLEALHMEYDLVVSQDVRLADGKVLQTCGCVELCVKFGRFDYKSTFFVLQENVPTILGMMFLRSVKPDIDWKKRVVRVGHLNLPVCRVFSGVEPVGVTTNDNSKLGGNLRFQNSFELLDDQLLANDADQQSEVTPVIPLNGVVDSSV